MGFMLFFVDKGARGREGETWNEVSILFNDSLNTFCLRL